MATFTERMIGAARLDVRTYEEVEADPGATGQAMAVVILSSIAAGIGAGRGGFTSLMIVMVASLIGWFLWALLTFFIGTRILPEPETRSNIGELLRTIGFSSSPGILRLLGFIPFAGWLITLVVFFWMLATMVVAVRQALDYKSTGRALAVCLIGWLIYIIVMAVLASVLGVGLTG